MKLLMREFAHYGAMKGLSIQVVTMQTIHNAGKSEEAHVATSVCKDQILAERSRKYKDTVPHISNDQSNKTTIYLFTSTAQLY